MGDGSTLVIRRAGGVYRIGPARDFMRVLEFSSESVARNFLQEQIRAGAGLEWLRELLAAETGQLELAEPTDDEVLDRGAQMLALGGWRVAELKELGGGAVQEVETEAPIRRAAPPKEEKKWVVTPHLDAEYKAVLLEKSGGETPPDPTFVDIYISYDQGGGRYSGDGTLKRSGDNVDVLRLAWEHLDRREIYMQHAAAMGANRCWATSPVAQPGGGHVARGRGRRQCVDHVVGVPWPPDQLGRKDAD